ncbi:unnamed protein product, partial [marine sediment metagenome]
MVYQEHPLFESPEDENQEIWRFMDFAKFVSIIDKKSLFFPNSDELPDAWEGTYTKRDSIFLEALKVYHEAIGIPEEYNP